MNVFREQWGIRCARLMRVCTIMLGLAALCPLPASAQWLGLGAKGGVSIATQGFEGDEGSPSLDSRIGGVAGVFATVPLLSWLDLQPEALYAMKGARLDLRGVESSVWVDYLEVPILARISRTRGTIRYFGHAGPSIGVRLRARTRTKFRDAVEEIDIGDDLERLDVGMAAGGGVELGSIILDARYTLGFTDIDRDTTDAVKVTNRALSITAGFRF